MRKSEMHKDNVNQLVDMMQPTQKASQDNRLSLPSNSKEEESLSSMSPK